MVNPSYPHHSLPETGYVSAKTLAAALETSRSTIWRWSKSGRLPQPYRLSEGTTRWRVCEVRLALSANDDRFSGPERSRHPDLPMVAADKIAVAVPCLPPAQKESAIDEMFRLLKEGLQ